MRRFTLHLFLIALALVAIFPFIWVICGSVKPSQDLVSGIFLPWQHLDRLTLAHFRSLREQPFARWLLNSIFLSSTHCVLTVTLSSLGGFALAKYDFAGKRALTLLMLVTLLLPAQAMLPASYELMYHFGWIDSYFALILPAAVSVAGIFLMRQAIKAVPDELLHAGRIDGCSELRLWWDIALPVVRPMLGAYTLLSFLTAWNSFLWPQIILQSESKYTLTIGLSHMTGIPEYQYDLGVLMAATLIGIIPVAILFFALQRDFIAGLASGAVKG
jgi:ABC-type glycerol-3-phosphate transport system permease component